MPTRRLVNGTERNKQLAYEFIDGVIVQGQTDPSKALERAFACNPDAIYLLTDGEFDRAIIDLLKRLNVGGKVTVHTIGFIYKTGEAVLKAIAEQNGGQYRFVSEKDLAALSKPADSTGK
jgi:secreted protein with Ig-like and vWFA domain